MMYIPIEFLVKSIYNAIPNSVFDLSFGQKILIVGIMCFLSILSATIYLHRCKTHHSVILNVVVEHFFQIILCLNTGVKTVLWVIFHIDHHSHPDSSKDLHSPHNPITLDLFKTTIKIKGPLVPFIRYFYLLKPVDQKLKMMMDKRMKKEDWVSRFFYYKLSLLGPVILLVSYLILFGTSGIWMFAIQFLYLPIISGLGINGFGHAHKERHIETNDHSKNLLGFTERMPKVLYWALFPVWFILRLLINFMTGGEFEHYIHHFVSWSAKIAIKKWAIDVGWIVIYCLWRVRLAKELRYLDPETNKLKVLL